MMDEQAIARLEAEMNDPDAWGEPTVPPPNSPVEDLRKVALELAEGLQKVANTLTLSGEIRDTAEAMTALGPLFERFGEAMRRLPTGQP
jgi:hypothetical protein